jgi:hypothetical protein
MYVAVDWGADTQVMTRAAWVARPSPADVNAVRRVAPLAAGLTMRCGPFDVPVPVAASPASLETDTTEAAHAAREFIKDDPWAGMGSVHPGGWLLLARDDDIIVIGQRVGEVGLHRVAVLTRRAGGGFQARSLGGWRLSSSDPAEEVEAALTATVRELAVTVAWDCGQDLAGVANRVVSRCQVLESDTEVHFLLLSRANPAKPASASGLEVGTGKSATATFELKKPLGQRSLFDDSRLPAQPVAIAAPD